MTQRKQTQLHVSIFKMLLKQVLVKTVSTIKHPLVKADPTSSVIFIQKRTSFYNKYRHGPEALTNPKPDYVAWAREFFSVDGMRNFIKEEVEMVKKNPLGYSRKPQRIELNRTYIFEDFDTDESIKSWKAQADSYSLNGFSVAELKRTPAGHCQFKGILDNRIPDDGVTMKSGFAALIGPCRPRYTLIQQEAHWDWTGYNEVEIKFRGDGRRYTFVVNTSYNSDDTYYDNYSFHLYTRGGPYWQIARIPFSKLVFLSKGFVQESQGAMPEFRIRFIAFALQDGIDGPFCFEVDHIGLRKSTWQFKENTAYEHYVFPHKRYLNLQVDCDPPDRKLGSV